MPVAAAAATLASSSSDQAWCQVAALPWVMSGLARRAPALALERLRDVLQVAACSCSAPSCHDATGAPAASAPARLTVLAMRVTLAMLGDAPHSGMLAVQGAVHRPVWRQRAASGCIEQLAAMAKQRSVAGEPWPGREPQWGAQLLSHCCLAAAMTVLLHHRELRDQHAPALIPVLPEVLSSVSGLASVLCPTPHSARAAPAAGAWPPASGTGRPCGPAPTEPTTSTASTGPVVAPPSGSMCALVGAVLEGTLRFAEQLLMAAALRPAQEDPAVTSPASHALPLTHPQPLGSSGGVGHGPPQLEALLEREAGALVAAAAQACLMRQVGCCARW
jgi:hypothetical protein